MRIGACIGIGLIVVALAGCVPADPPVSPQPTSSVAPLFASDEEALAAAEEAYAAYLAMSDEISHDGGANPERIAPFVTPERLAIELEGFSSITEKGIHTEGSTRFEAQDLQRYDEREVVLYVCWDASAVRVFESDTDVTPIDRIDRQLLEAVFKVSAAKLILESDDQWSGDSC